MLGSSSWMPCAPQGVKGLDDDDEKPNMSISILHCPYWKV